MDSSLIIILVVVGLAVLWVLKEVAIDIFPSKEWRYKKYVREYDRFMRDMQELAQEELEEDKRKQERSEFHDRMIDERNK